SLDRRPVSVATEDSLPGPRHRHRAPRNRHTGIVPVAVTLLVVTLAGARWVMGGHGAPSPLAAASGGSAAAYPPCPVPPCTDYPVPSQVRGITIAALQNYLYFTPSVTAQISAAARSWNVNAVRLQIVQDKLVGASGHRYPLGYSRGYMHNIKLIVGF